MFFFGKRGFFFKIFASNFEEILKKKSSRKMCNCSNVLYLENAKFCHHCGDEIKRCVNCKVDLTCNDGNYCHLCGTRRVEMKLEEKFKIVKVDTQLLFLKKVMLEKWQKNFKNVHPADILIKKLFKKSGFKYLSDIDDINHLMMLWQTRRIVSTQQLVGEQMDITQQRRGAMESQEKVARSMMNFCSLKRVLEMELELEQNPKLESPIKTENCINVDTQLLFLKKVLIERWQENYSNVGLADILIKKLFKESGYKIECLRDFEELMGIWPNRRIVSTQQLIDEQADTTRRRKAALVSQEKVAESVMNFRGLKKVLEMEQSFI